MHLQHIKEDGTKWKSSHSGGESWSEKEAFHLAFLKTSCFESGGNSGSPPLPHPRLQHQSLVFWAEVLATQKRFKSRHDSGTKCPFVELQPQAVWGRRRSRGPSRFQGGTNPHSLAGVQATPGFPRRSQISRRYVDSSLFWSISS